MLDDKHVERVDTLTGCANLLSFLETLSVRLAAVPNSAFSLLLVDLNNFMAFNAAHGHTQGDSVLHWVGIVLRDTGLPVFRIGGDEFAGQLMQLLIDMRAIARKKKDFEIADGIRKRLTEMKVTLEDRPDGTIWRRE